MDARLSLTLRLNRGRTLTPSQLADDLRLTPQRLAAALDELTRLGFAIESHPHLGLRLVAAPAGLIEEEVACDLAVRRVGRRVRCVDETASTNDLAWDAAARGPAEADGLAVFAEHQEAGRGRRGNRWLSPAHASVLCSVLIWAPDASGQAAVLTRAAAVAVAEAVEDQCDLSVGIKWPNDLVVEDRKVGGILAEARPVAAGPSPVVLGIGINCTQATEAFPAEVRHRVASLAAFGEEVDRTLLARSLLVRLDEVLWLAADAAGAGEIHSRAAARCRTLGRRITLLEGGDTYAGEVIGLDPDYGLVLRLAEGGLRRFPALTSHVLAE
jgi:BirA family biotin operon repressor/biotin-[acetyl-CoA-carboxylase] ligase